MARTNIFELLAKNTSISKDAIRLDNLFTTAACFEQEPSYNQNSYSWTLKEYVDSFCFAGWKNRHRCLDVKDYFETIEYDKIFIRAQCGSFDDFLTFIEIVYNFWYLAVKKLDEATHNGIVLSKRSTGDYTAAEIKDFLDDCLSEYNQKAVYSEAEEKCLVMEDSPQATAAAEASEPEIALEILRYNHRQLAGDIPKKKAILKNMGDHLEGRKIEINSINSSLYNNITGALNNLNIRHNNTNPANKSYYHKAVAEMPVEELEQHYDDLYQLFLLAILEMDNVPRQREMRELIQVVTRKDLN